MEITISPSQGARFDTIVQKEPCVAKFHRPGCPYCVELEPVWKTLLQTPEIADMKSPFLSVHSDAIQDITSKCAENITGVPTIMIIYNNGKSRKMHANGNNLNGILKFIIDNKKLLTQDGGGKTRRGKTRRGKTRRGKTRRGKTRRRISSKNK